MSWQPHKNKKDLSPHQYSDGINNKKILIFGIIPPPLGGISVHIQRVMDKLRKQKNQLKLMHNEKPWYMMPIYLIKILFFLVYFRPQVIMYHALYFRHTIIELYVLVLLKQLFKFKILFVDHDPRYMYKRGYFWKLLFNYILSWLDQVILVGTSTYQSYIDNAIQKKNLSVESVFLPPDTQNEHVILETYPKELNIFLEQHRPLLLVNASQLVLLDGTMDLYGIDQAINVLKKITTIYSNAGLVFALATIGDEEYFYKLQHKIKEDDLQDHVFVLTGQKELWPLFKKVDVFIRPTLSDSFGISVAESLFFNTPVVASDVCYRQKGAVLFKAGDCDDLYQKVLTILQAGVSDDYCSKPSTKNMQYMK